jgi:hypothetical protein
VEEVSHSNANCFQRSIKAIIEAIAGCMEWIVSGTFSSALRKRTVVNVDSHNRVHSRYLRLSHPMFMLRYVARPTLFKGPDIITLGKDRRDG